jgi:hypothetical protein
VNYIDKRLLNYAPGFFLSDDSLNIKFLENYEGCYGLQDMVDLLESHKFTPVFELLIHIFYREIKFRENLFQQLIEQKNKTIETMYMKFFIEEILFKKGVII